MTDLTAAVKADIKISLYAEAYMKGERAERFSARHQIVLPAYFRW
jgi:hypothetical protein